MSLQHVGPDRLDRHPDAIHNQLITRNLSNENAFDLRFSSKIVWRFKTNRGLGGQSVSSEFFVEFLSPSPRQRDGRMNHANPSLLDGTTPHCHCFCPRLGWMSQKNLRVLV